jgi:hypothetical protein
MDKLVQLYMIILLSKLTLSNYFDIDREESLISSEIDLTSM